MCSESARLGERCEASRHRFVLDLVEELAADSSAMVAHGRLGVLPARLFSQQVRVLVSMAPRQDDIALALAALHGTEQVTEGELRPAPHLVMPENPRQRSLHAPDQTVSRFVGAGTAQYSVAENTPPLTPPVSKIKSFIFCHGRIYPRLVPAKDFTKSIHYRRNARICQEAGFKAFRFRPRSRYRLGYRSNEMGNKETLRPNQSSLRSVLPKSSRLQPKTLLLKFSRDRGAGSVCFGNRGNRSPPCVPAPVGWRAKPRHNWHPCEDSPWRHYPACCRWMPSTESPLWQIPPVR